jgi:hypothetical protein
MQPHLLLTVLCCHSTYDSKLGTHHVQSPSGPSINDPRLCMYPTLSKHKYLLTRQEIVTRADLNTLCITSKAYHAYVIPRLYERVYLRIWNRDEVLRFIGCVSAGASPNLRHTRTLVVEDRRLIEFIPLSCYLRAEQTDALNRTVAVGVPISRAVLRESQPFTDVLDFDLIAKPWEQWAGRVSS